MKFGINSQPRLKGPKWADEIEPARQKMGLKNKMITPRFCKVTPSLSRVIPKC